MLPGSTTIGWIVPKKYVEKSAMPATEGPVGAGHTSMWNSWPASG